MIYCFDLFICVVQSEDPFAIQTKGLWATTCERSKIAVQSMSTQIAATRMRLHFNNEKHDLHETMITYSFKLVLQ
jgi:hypothetical protein